MFRSNFRTGDVIVNRPSPIIQPFRQKSTKIDTRATAFKSTEPAPRTFLGIAEFKAKELREKGLKVDLGDVKIKVPVLDDQGNPIHDHAGVAVMKDKTVRLNDIGGTAIDSLNKLVTLQRGTRQDILDNKTEIIANLLNIIIGTEEVRQEIADLPFGAAPPLRPPARGLAGIIPGPSGRSAGDILRGFSSSALGRFSSSAPASVSPGFDPDDPQKHDDPDPDEPDPDEPDPADALSLLEDDPDAKSPERKDEGDIKRDTSKRLTQLARDIARDNRSERNPIQKAERLQVSNDLYTQTDINASKAWLTERGFLRGDTIRSIGNTTVVRQAARKHISTLLSPLFRRNAVIGVDDMRIPLTLIRPIIGVGRQARSLKGLTLGRGQSLDLTSRDINGNMVVRVTSRRRR